MSSTKQLQTDGASEVVNRMVGKYIRCFCNYEQDDWDLFFSCAEFAYNSAVPEDLGLSSFEVDLGWKPRGPLDMLLGTTTQLD